MPNAGSMIPFFEEADYVTATATVAVLGKQLVKITGPAQSDGTYSVGPCGATDANNAIGVAAFNAAIGQRVTIAPLDTFDGIVPLLGTGAAVTAGDHLTTAANGAVVTTTTAGTKCVAIAFDSSAVNADVQAVLSRHTI